MSVGVPRGALSSRLPAAEVSAVQRILVVDDAQRGGGALPEFLRDFFLVREEADGEAAWQALLVDPSIVAVVAARQIRALNADALLERLRSARFRRLQQLPFLVLSDSETAGEAGSFCAHGVADHVSRDLGGAEILARLNHLLALSGVQARLEAGRQSMIRDPDSGLLSRKYLELQAAQALAHSSRHGVDVSVLVLGFDGYADLVERFGFWAVEEAGRRVGRLLGTRMRCEDSLGCFGDGQLAIVSPGSAPDICTRFAERVRVEIESASGLFDELPLRLTVSIGLSSAPADQVVSAGGLFDLAEHRMQLAMLAGGNCLENGGSGAMSCSLSIQRALELLATGRPDAVVPYLPELFGQMLPLMQLMNRELGLAPPLAEIERRLNERKS